jgi:hypothetical protein
MENLLPLHLCQFLLSYELFLWLGLRIQKRLERYHLYVLGRGTKDVSIGTYLWRIFNFFKFSYQLICRFADRFADQLVVYRGLGQGNKKL